jgi:hypothetical protein
MYTIYSLKYHSWCVFKDNAGTLTSTLIKSGFATYDDAKSYIRGLKS